MRGADDHVVEASKIRVLYSYPFRTTGPRRCFTARKRSYTL
jgi:hypothetical protein